MDHGEQDDDSLSSSSDGGTPKKKSESTIILHIQTSCLLLSPLFDGHHPNSLEPPTLFKCSSRFFGQLRVPRLHKWVLHSVVDIYLEPVKVPPK